MLSSGQTQTKSNHHCSVVEIGGKGVLIEGRSGAGKTSLALGLLERSVRLGLGGFFVCDDQAYLEARRDALFAVAPAAIAGKAELRGYGIVTLPNKPETRGHVIAKLVEDSRIKRMPEPVTEKRLGIPLTMIEVPERHEERAARIILAWLADGKLQFE